jgi:hypothetical protein
LQDKDVAAGGETPPVRTHPDDFAAVLQKFVTEQVGDGAVLTDWFVSFGAMKQSDDSPTGIGYAVRYLSSDGSPQGAYGIAKLGVNQLRTDLTFDAGPMCTGHDDEG